MLPVLYLIDLPNMWNYLKDWHWGNLGLMVPGALLGISIGALTFRHVNDDVIRILLGALTLIFSMSYFFSVLL